MLATEGKIKAILPYFGGKRTMAPLIVRELGKHRQYYEPFCGSLAVTLAKPPCEQETVSDLYGDATNLARCLADSDVAARLYERCSRTLFAEALLDDAARVLEREYDCDSVDEERAYWFFISSWMMRNGTAGMDRNDFQIAVRFTQGGGSPSTRFRNAIESIPAWNARLRNVLILRRDAFALLPRFPDAEGLAIYADPPYFKGSRAHGDYKHDFNHEASMFGQCDHTRLRNELARFKRARVVVSYYDHSVVRYLYEGWKFVECGRQKNIARQNGVGTETNEAPEVLIINGPSYSEGKVA